LKTLKSAVLTLTARASVTTTNDSNPGDRDSERDEYRTSCHNALNMVNALEQLATSVPIIPMMKSAAKRIRVFLRYRWTVRIPRAQMTTSPPVDRCCRISNRIETISERRLDDKCGFALISNQDGTIYTAEPIH
jgi:hypothetical protein